MLYFAALSIIAFISVSKAGGSINAEWITVGNKRCQLFDGCRSRSDWMKDDDWKQCGNKKYPNLCYAKCDGYDSQKMGQCQSCSKDPSYITPYIDIPCAPNDCSSSNPYSGCSECSKYEECSARKSNKCEWGVYEHSSHVHRLCVANCGQGKDKGGDSGKAQYGSDGGKSGYGQQGDSIKPGYGWSGGKSGDSKNGNYGSKSNEWPTKQGGAGKGNEWPTNQVGSGKSNEWPTNQGGAGKSNEWPTNKGGSGKGNEWPTNQGKGGKSSEWPHQKKDEAWPTMKR